MKRKSLIFAIIAIIALFAMATNVNAEGENVVEVDSVQTLIDAIDNASTDGTVTTIKLLDSIENASKMVIDSGKNVTINLNGFNISGDANANPLFYISNGVVKVEGAGTITSEGDAFYLLGNTGNDWKTVAIKAEVEIGASVKVIANECCIFLKGNGAKADIYGNLTSIGVYATIQGNGNENSGNTIINIYDGASILHESSLAIYHPQSGKLNVYGGKITGTTGIEMRAGELVVEAGTIVGTAEELTVNKNGNGSTTQGAGIAIAQHDTELATSVVIKGGTIQGYAALYESNPEGNDKESIDKVSIEIIAGNFETINNGPVAVFSENKTQFITGGTFSTDVTAYTAEGSVGKEVDGSFVFGKENEINILPVENGKIEVDKEAAIVGETVTLTPKANEGYELKSITVVDENGKVITVTNNTFKMPDGKVTVSAEFIKIADSQPNEKDKTPDTGIETATTVFAVIAVISLAGLVLIKKK